MVFISDEVGAAKVFVLSSATKMRFLSLRRMRKNGPKATILERAQEIGKLSGKRSNREKILFIS